MSVLLVGQVIRAVYLSANKETLRLDFTDGSHILAETYGDCCSSTWIESLDNVDALVGGLILAAEDIAMPEQEYDHEQYECLAFYGFKITTDKGHCTIDYRNSSNGYYGGSLDWPAELQYGEPLAKEWELLGEMVPPPTTTQIRPRKVKSRLL